MAFKLSGDAKKIVDRGAQQNSAAPVSKPAPVQKSQASVTGGNPNTQAVAKPSTGGFKLNNESKALVDNANRFTVQGPKTFQFAGNYYSEDGAGNYIKNSYIKKQSDRDKKKVEETGHETLGTDIGQATKAGLKGWVAPQLSTLATVPLAITAAVHGDNHYEPQAGGGLWKMLNASHAENQEAARLREASTEGRGTVGSTLLEGYSSAVTNGIDTALSLIPYVGPTLTKVSFASRAFGGSAQAARDEGKGIGTQVLTGAVSAAIEAATENLWTYGGVRDITGGAIQNTGPLGNLTNKLESSLAKKAGPIVSRLAMTFGTEMTEEMMADVLNPIASFAIKNTLGKTKLFEDYEGEEWQGVGNMLHDGFVGGIAGILGGVSSAVEAVDTYRQSGSNNALYATALRQQFETQRAEAKANSGFANAIRKASFVDALDTLMSRKTGKTVSEKVSEARGTYVNRRDAFKMIGDMDADYQQVCQQVAKKFADDNFSNELISKDTLEKAVYKYLVNGEFAEELNTMDDVKNQIATLTKDIMTEYDTELQNKANSKKDKARAAFYSSLLSQMVNQNVTEQTETEAAPEVTEYQTYGYTADELAEDQARVQAEAEAAAQAEAEAARPQFSKKDQNRIDSIFNDPNKAVRLGQTEKDNAIRDAIYARAEAEGKEVVETTRGNKTEYKIVNRVAEAPVETQQNIDNATVSEYNNPTETIENTGVEANGTEEGTAVPGLGGETGEGLSTGRENDTGLGVEGQNGDADSALVRRHDVEAEEAQAEAQTEEAEAAEEMAEAEAETEAEEPEVETEAEGTVEEEAEQPKAARRKPISEAHAVAEKTFGKEGRVKATRVVEAFKRIKTPFKKNKAGTWGEHAKVVNGKFDKMLNVLMDVNDGYGTVKNVYNNYKTWRDNRLMSAYYDADISNGFYRLVAEANEKGWEFNEQEHADFAQAYEDLCNAMIAKVNNVNRDTERLYKLRGEAIANKLNIKSDGLISKAIQKWLRMQATTDTAMKFFGGFKGSGEFYDLAKDIKNSVARRMVEYVDAYSYFDSVKQMKGFNDFISGKKYKLDPQSDSLEANPFEGQDFTMQQIVAMKRLLLTMEDTVLKDSDATVAERVKGLVIKDAKGNSTKIDLSDLLGTDSADSINAIIESCNNILNQDTDAAKCARAYDEACSKMFNKIGSKVSDTKKAITGLGLTLIGENYTPLLWEKEDGTSDYNFSRSDRIKSPSFTYERTDAGGYLVVQDISKIVDKYIEKAADYIGTAQIKDTLARMNEGNNLVNNGRGLNSVLAENFGREAGSWFDEYVKDLTQYQETDSIWAALRRNMQKGALIGSPSVMMKQVSSYWSAMGLLSPEALTAAYRWKVGVGAEDFSAVNSKLKYRHISDKFDPTLSEMIQDMSKYGSVSNSRVFKLFTNGISEQDYKTVDNLFAATMLDTYMKNQDRGAEYFASGEFQEAVDSKFTEVMMRSQPMFDTELRAEYARTDNELVKMTSMFRTQQTQNLNLIATAIGEYNAAKGTDAQSEKAQVLRQTVAGQIAATVSLSLLTLAADAMLHGLKKYRGDGDDDDEKPGDGKIELQRILGRVGLNAAETGAGTMWLGDYVAKWLIDRMSGGETSEYYGVNFGPLTTLKNLMETVEYAVKKPTRSNIKNCATNISQLMGIPLNNAYRILNSAAMYYCDITGENPNNYDDILKMWDANVTVAEKNNAGKNLLIESGLSKKEATNFIKEIDTDNDGLSKDELEEYYIEHPDEAEKVSILWDSMGWKQTFAKAKKGLDKKVTYASNPLYAEMDEDESGSVTKSEMMQYALAHEDQLDELSELYREQGYKGTFRSALKSAENEQLKEQAEDAFYEGDYNVLFDTVSQMKNGKSYLTNLVKDEYDEYDNVSNPLIRFMIDAKRPTKEIDEAVEAYGTKKLIPQYKALRATGLSPSAAIKKLDGFDANANGSITQAELAEYYKAHKDEEAMIAEFWKACGWSTTWAKYKKSKKLK